MLRLLGLYLIAWGLAGLFLNIEGRLIRQGKRRRSVLDAMAYEDEREP